MQRAKAQISLQIQQSAKGSDAQTQWSGPSAYFFFFFFFYLVDQLFLDKGENTGK